MKPREPPPWGGPATGGEAWATPGASGCLAHVPPCRQCRRNPLKTQGLPHSASAVRKRRAAPHPRSDRGWPGPRRGDHAPHPCALAPTRTPPTAPLPHHGRAPPPPLHPSPPPAAGHATAPSAASSTPPTPALPTSRSTPCTPPCPFPHLRRRRQQRHSHSTSHAVAVQPGRGGRPPRRGLSYAVSGRARGVGRLSVLTFRCGAHCGFIST